MSRSPDAPPRDLRLGLEWMAALAITAVALFLLLNGSFFCSYSAPHIDLSINLTAAHALRDGMNPYGATTLHDRAVGLGSPTDLVYGQLFTSYIQPPTSALSLLPLTTLPWRDATRLFLVLNHVFLFSAVAVSLYTLRPSVPTRWLIAGVCALLAAFSQVYASFALGQWDAALCLLLAVAFWGYCNNHPAVSGAAIAYAAAIKLIPGLLLLYFLWRREYRIVIWGIGVGVALFALSYAYVGCDVWHTYLTETLPALMKGSSQYANAGFGALIARLHTPEVIRGLPELLYLDEVPDSNTARLAGLAVELAGLIAIALVVPFRPLRADERRPERLVFEFYLVITIGLLISSVTWEFYVVWLIPLFMAVFFAAPKTLPSSPARWLLVGSFLLVFVLLNYPGDFYLFGRNDFFFHPGWVPGAWVENRVHLYHDHLDAVLLLRLPALLMLAALCADLAIWRRRSAIETS